MFGSVSLAADDDRLADHLSAFTRSPGAFFACFNRREFPGDRLDVFLALFRTYQNGSPKLTEDHNAFG